MGVKTMHKLWSLAGLGLFWGILVFFVSFLLFFPDLGF